jgi:hypothetical protein
MPIRGIRRGPPATTQAWAATPTRYPRLVPEPRRVETPGVPVRLGVPVKRASVLVVALVAVVLVGGPAAAQTTADRAYVGYTVAGATPIGERGTRLDER